MFTKFTDPVPPFSVFLRLLLKSVLIGILLITIALGAGMWGYHYYEKMPWVDAFVNAAMILSGMGPVSTLATDDGKLFAGFYALFSGLFFILIMGILLAPLMHRLFHKFHSALKSEKA
jgi:hypothetical protein